VLVADFISLLRARLGDEQTPYLWEDDELLIYLNQTISDIYTELSKFDIKEIATSANTYQYSIIGRPLRVLLNNRILWPVSKQAIDDAIQNESLTGRPETFYGEDNLLLVYPIPDAEYTLSVVSRYTPAYTMADEFDFDDTELLLLGCMCKAYTKQDSEIAEGKTLASIYQLFSARLARYKSLYVRDRSTSQPSYVHRGLL